MTILSHCILTARDGAQHLLYNETDHPQDGIVDCRQALATLNVCSVQ